MVLEITQLNYDGHGNNRVFRQYVVDATLRTRLSNIRRAYNLNSTTVTVDDTPVDWDTI